MRALSLAVVGADHPNKRGPTRRFEIALCIPGEPIELRPEPKNPVDKRAIAVFSARDVQLGYLTAERATLIGARLARGEDLIAIFQEPTTYGCAIRVGFGAVPNLPAPREVVPWEEPEFFADEDWEGEE